MTITIDKNIPIPLTGKGKSKYPFGALEVGDSFFINTIKSQVIHSCARQYLKLHNPTWELTVRRVNENNVEGVRVWRVK